MQITSDDIRKAAESLEQAECTLTMAGLREVLPYIPKLQAIRFLRATSVAPTLAVAVTVYNILVGEGR